MKTRWLLSILLILISAAFAQVDPPGRVARVNYATGVVSMLTQSTGNDWLPAQINYPMTNGDQIWTDFGGRADLQLGTASMRLRDQTSATFTALDDRTVQVQLVAGGLNIHVRNLYPDEIFEIDTPNVAFTIRQPGDYRVDVNDAQTKIFIWGGAAEISGDGRTVPLRAKDLAVITGYNRLAYNLTEVPGPDEFDRWSFDRNRRSQQSVSARYVSSSMIGYEDLDDHGSWRNVPSYGMVWAPRVEAGWAPYKLGHWAWVEPWGWTWIDDAPWGFAPFHYGRWAFASDSWVWVPGPPAQRAVYSPALVAWCGGSPGGGVVSAGGGFRISASIGAGLAWFALGPSEVYVPSHRASAAYVNNVNISNTNVSRTVVTNVYNTTIVNHTVVNNITYVNQQAPGAVVGMSHADMASGRRGAAVSLAPAVAQSVQVSPVAPVPAQRPVLQPVARNAPSAPPIARPPAAVMSPSHPVMMRNQPPPAATQRPVFTPASGGPAPARVPNRQAEPIARPVAPPSAPPAGEQPQLQRARPVTPPSAPLAGEPQQQQQRARPLTPAVSPSEQGGRVPPNRESEMPRPPRPPVPTAEQPPRPRPAPPAQRPESFEKPPVAPTRTIERPPPPVPHPEERGPEAQKRQEAKDEKKKIEKKDDKQ